MMRKKMKMTGKKENGGKTRSKSKTKPGKRNSRRYGRGKQKAKEWKKGRKEWRKEGKIIYVRKCKVWRNQYKEAKKELEERRAQRKNKKIEIITKEIRQNIRKGNTRKVCQRLNEMKQGGKMKG